MNIKKLNEAIEQFKEDLDGALLSCDIWDKETGLTIAGFNSNDKNTALIGRITNTIEKSLDDLGFPSFGEYQIIDLEIDAMILVIHFDKKYLWGNLIDKSKVSLGLLMGLAIPRAKDLFLKAFKEE